MIGGFATKLLFSIYNYSIRTSEGKFFILWDTFISVSSDMETTVPIKPLEDGRFSTNSKIRKPQIITIEAVKSSPFTIYKDIQKLNEAVKSAQLFTISTRYGNYKNYTLQKFSYSLDQRTATSLHASMVFHEVIIIKTEYAKLTTSNVRNAQSSSVVSGGKKQMKKDASLALKLFKKGLNI